MKNKSLTAIKIIDYTHDGLGIAKIDNVPIFIKGAMLNEVVNAKVTKINKKFMFGSVTEITKASPSRVKPICEHYEQCGGCNVMHLEYSAQLDFKRNVVDNLFRKYKLKAKVATGVASPEDLYYRNKVITPVKNINGQLVAGFYKPRSHDLVAVDNCYIQEKVLTKIANDTMEVLNLVNEVAYDEDSQKGNIRNLCLRIGKQTNEVMLIIICAKSSIKSHKFLIDTVKEKNPELKSVILNINSKKTNAALGYKNIVL